MPLLDSFPMEREMPLEMKLVECLATLEAFQPFQLANESSEDTCFQDTRKLLERHALAR